MQHTVWKEMIWAYSLSVPEEALAARLGFARQEPMLAQPFRNRNYSEGDIWESWQHMIAVGSEIALARMIGLSNFVPDVNTFRSREDIPGHEVRYSFQSQSGPKLRFTVGLDNPEKKYVLMMGGPEIKTRRTPINGWRGNPYQAVGWMYGRDCINPDYYYKGKTYYVPQLNLSAMDDLPYVEKVEG
jgi:hypothetical protein